MKTKKKLRMMKFQYTYPLILMVLVLIPLFVLVFMQNNVDFDTRNKAAVADGEAFIEVISDPSKIMLGDPNPRFDFFVKNSTSIIDGIQLTGKIHTKSEMISFNLASPSGLLAVREKINQANDGYEFEIAFVTIDPESPHLPDPHMLIASVEINPQTTDPIVFEFNPQHSKIMKNSLAADVLDVPEIFKFSVYEMRVPKSYRPPLRLECKTDSDCAEGQICSSISPDSKWAHAPRCYDVILCEDKCGDGFCDELVCTGEGCPCPESPTSCVQDCK